MDAGKARRAAECVDPADRLHNPHPAEFPLHSISRGIAADCRSLPVRVIDYALVVTPQTSSLDCRPARRLLRGHAAHPGTGMRPRWMDDGALQPGRVG